jgi:hypothetical protein
LIIDFGKIIQETLFPKKVLKEDSLVLRKKFLPKVSSLVRKEQLFVRKRRNTIGYLNLVSLELGKVSNEDFLVDRVQRAFSFIYKHLLIAQEVSTACVGDKLLHMPVIERDYQYTMTSFTVTIGFHD